MCAVIIEDFKGLIIFITLRSRVQLPSSLQKNPLLNASKGFFIDYRKLFSF